MAVKRMWLLDCGRLVVDGSILTYRRNMGQSVVIPVAAAVVETDDGYLLFDTGLDPEAVADSSVLGEKASVVSALTVDDDIRTRLASIGVSPNDVRWVVNSHLHWDHTGGNRYFPQAEFILQREEWRFARSPDRFVAPIYLEHQYDLDRNYTLIDGSSVIVDGVAVLNTRGHTPGHQSLVVELPDAGYFIVSGDAVYCPENLNEMLPPGNAWDMREAYRSMTELVFWQRHFDAEVIIGHDPQLWDNYAAQTAFH